MDAGHTKMLEWEAADEIERLREELKERSDELRGQYLQQLGY